MFIPRDNMLAGASSMRACSCILMMIRMYVPVAIPLGIELITQAH
jgi:hypothetical protein